jgi:hypothetical protein
MKDPIVIFIKNKRRRAKAARGGSQGLASTRGSGPPGMTYARTLRVVRNF